MNRKTPSLLFSRGKQILRWSCWTRGGIDFVYRRIVSYVRQSLTVALCLDDDDVAALCPSFPALSTCPSVRLEEWSARSMQLAAARNLSVQRSDRPPATAGIETTTTGFNTTAPPPSVVPGREVGVAAPAGATQQATGHGAGVEGAPSLCPEFAGKGSVCLWSGATHANLVGGLAFGRFQSTVPAYRDSAAVPLGAGADSGTSDRAGAHVAELIKKDENKAAEESERLFDAWMILVEPSCCVEVFQAVVGCTGGGGGSGGGGGGGGEFVGEESSSGDQGQPRWGALKAMCFRAMAEEGRGPRPASLGQVLLLFKHFCRLGCRRQVKMLGALYANVPSTSWLENAKDCSRASGPTCSEHHADNII